MRGAPGVRRGGEGRGRGRVTVAVLTVLLTAGGCATGSGGTADSSGKDVPPKASAGSLTWEFEHIADFSGKITDVAALAKDDVWAVATENNGESNAHLLHYDGTHWKRESLPEALGTSLYPPALEEVGEKTLWLRPQTAEDASAVNRWAQWDGSRWSPVPNPRQAVPVTSRPQARTTSGPSTPPSRPPSTGTAPAGPRPDCLTEPPTWRSLDRPMSGRSAAAQRGQAPNWAPARATASPPRCTGTVRPGNRWTPHRPTSRTPSRRNPVLSSARSSPSTVVRSARTASTASTTARSTTNPRTSSSGCAGTAPRGSSRSPRRAVALCARRSLRTTRAFSWTAIGTSPTTAHA